MISGFCANPTNQDFRIFPKSGKSGFPEFPEIWETLLCGLSESSHKENKFWISEEIQGIENLGFPENRNILISSKLMFPGK